jgi:hypothetical protein
MSLALQQIIDFVSLLNYKNIFKFYSIGWKKWNSCY